MPCPKLRNPTRNGSTMAHCCAFAASCLDSPALGVLLCGWFFGWAGILGFLVGAGISYINHRWLERMVEALGERMTTGNSSERGGLLVLRALLRYVSIGIAAYAIFKVSRAGLYGFLSGVCLPIAAVGCETGVELYIGLRHEH